jgi:hypothetical protein
LPSKSITRDNSGIRLLYLDWITSVAELYFLQNLGWKRKDPFPKQTRPIPKSVLVKVTRLARKYGQPRDLAIMDLAWIGFFFLLRPSKHLYA